MYNGFNADKKNLSITSTKLMLTGKTKPDKDKFFSNIVSGFDMQLSGPENYYAGNN